MLSDREKIEDIFEFEDSSAEVMISKFDKKR